MRSPSSSAFASLLQPSGRLTLVVYSRPRPMETINRQSLLRLTGSTHSKRSEENLVKSLPTLEVTCLVNNTTVDIVLDEDLGPQVASCLMAISSSSHKPLAYLRTQDKLRRTSQQPKPWTRFEPRENRFEPVPLFDIMDKCIDREIAP